VKILHINSHNFGSTGSIMLGLAEEARSRGHRCVTASPPGRSMVPGLRDHWFIGTRLGRNLHLLAGEWTGLTGCFSLVDTWLFLRRAERFDPDVVHLHNLHNGYLNLPMVMAWLARRNRPVVWTLHDCWAFTGKCPYFDTIGCDRWRTGCHDCPQLSSYPRSRVDNTRRMWENKRRWFALPELMTLVTPSRWLADLVGRSFLKGHPLRVIPNGIDLDVFRPIPSSFRRDRGLEGKFMVLGVAFQWTRHKGLDVFEALARRLDDRFRIVLVGVDPETPVPEGVLALPRTLDRESLAKIYTAADVFVNPTREEVLGMVNLEALACGTPVVTFRTGGSPECVDETCGTVVDKDDTDAMERAIRRICGEGPYGPEACRRAAEKFDRKCRFGEYGRLYEEIADKI